jgi:hypothetical protein
VGAVTGDGEWPLGVSAGEFDEAAGVAAEVDADAYPDAGEPPGVLGEQPGPAAAGADDDGTGVDDSAAADETGDLASLAEAAAWSTAVRVTRPAAFIKRLMAWFLDGALLAFTWITVLLGYGLLARVAGVGLPTGMGRRGGLRDRVRVRGDGGVGPGVAGEVLPRAARHVGRRRAGTGRGARRPGRSEERAAARPVRPVPACSR